MLSNLMLTNDTEWHDNGSYVLRLTPWNLSEQLEKQIVQKDRVRVITVNRLLSTCLLYLFLLNLVLFDTTFNLRLFPQVEGEGNGDLQNEKHEEALLLSSHQCSLVFCEDTSYFWVSLNKCVCLLCLSPIVLDLEKDDLSPEHNRG